MMPAPIRRHIRKQDAALLAAQWAKTYLKTAIRDLELAEQSLEKSGWAGARVGIRQANARLKSWQQKIELELAAIKRGRL